MFKDFNLLRREAGRATASSSAARRARAGIVHFWTCRPIAPILSMRRWIWRTTLGTDVRAVRDADSVLRNRGFRALGKRRLATDVPTVDGTPITRYWLIPPDERPKMFMPHPTMNSEEMRQRTQGVWDRFYSFARCGSGRAARRICARGWRSFLFPSCTGRCTRAPASPPIAPARLAPTAGLAGWPCLPRFFKGSRCRDCRCRARRCRNPK